MSRSTILLVISLFPLAAIVYLIAAVVIHEALYGMAWQIRGMIAFLVSGLVAWAFISVYWMLLWRKRVHRTPQRIAGTGIAFAVASLVAATLGVPIMIVDLQTGAFIASVVAPLLWLLATVFIWRGSVADHRADSA